MEQSEALKTQEVNGLVVKEDKKTVAKIWEKAVKTGVSIEKMKLKATPVMLKIAGFLAPELLPILIPISKFLKSKSGKKYMEMSEKNLDAMGKAATGDTSELKKNVENYIGFLDTDDGKEYVKDAVNLAKGLGGK